MALVLVIQSKWLPSSAQAYFRGNDLYQLDRYGKIGHAYPVLWEPSS